MSEPIQPLRRYGYAIRHDDGPPGSEIRPNPTPEKIVPRHLGGTRPLPKIAAEIADALPDNSVSSDAIDGSLGDFKYSSEIRFTPGERTAVDWEAGDVELSDGTTYSIVAGTLTGMVGGYYYIYLDTDVSTTVLQTTTTIATAMGENKYLLAMCRRGLDTDDDASCWPLYGLAQIDSSGLNDDCIRAAQILAGEIVAAHMTVTTLAAITADLGTVTAGTLAASIIVAATSFTGTVAAFTGRITVGSGGGVTEFNDAVRFKTGGSIQVEDGRIIEFYDSGNVFRGDIRATGSGGLGDGLKMYCRGNWEWTGGHHVQGSLELDGALNHDGSTIGLFGGTPAVRDAVADMTSLNTISGTGDDGNLNSNFSTIESKINELLNALQSYNLV